MRIVFGEFILDTDERRLVTGERDVRLSPKTFDLLAMLLESRPKALSKDVIFARLWPDVFVTENNLATLIADLRSALGDNAHRPQYIRTVYAYGYAFTGEATEQSPVATVSPTSLAGPSHWRLVHANLEIQLQQGENILGRTGPGVVVLDSPTISRHHARLLITGDRATLEDLGSKNGTWVHSTPVTAPVPLSDGDELRLGSMVLVIRCTAPGTSTESVEIC